MRSSATSLVWNMVLGAIVVLGMIFAIFWFRSEEEIAKYEERHSFYIEPPMFGKEKIGKHIVYYNLLNYQGYLDSVNQKGTWNEQRARDIINQMKIKYPEADEIILTAREGTEITREPAMLVGHFKKEKPEIFLFVDHGWVKREGIRYKKEVGLLAN